MHEQPTSDRFLILTCFKNEAPFLLEWIAYHRAIGFHDFLIYSNDCDDGTDLILDRLAQMGYLTHRDNAQKPGQRPSHQARAFKKAQREPSYQVADWVAVIDADEFINIHVGDKRIQDLVDAVPTANTISLTWRVFGSGEQIEYRPGFITKLFTHAAPLFCPRPAQAWGLKTIFRQNAFKGLGVHRPRIPTNENWDEITWVNGSGKVMPERYHTDKWRSDRESYGYDLAQVNHYALRSTHSFLMKQLRGRAFGGRELNMVYWNQMNRNEEVDTSIRSMLRRAQKEFNRLMKDEKLKKLHQDACAYHADQIHKVLRTDTAQETLQQMNITAAESPANA